MEFQVTITLSDRFFVLLEDKLPNLGRRVEKALSKELEAKVRKESNIEVKVLDNTEEPVIEQAPVVEEPKPTAKVEEVEEVKEVTPEMARKALADTRRRLLGDDYESQKGTPKYKAITSLAKQIIMTVSEGRESNLPSLNPQERAKFIDECNALVLDEDGNPCHPKATF